MAFFGTKEVGPTVFDIPPGGAEEATATKVCQSEKFPLRINGNFWHHEIG
jgi:hypothetical protein